MDGDNLRGRGAWVWQLGDQEEDVEDQNTDQKRSFKTEPLVHSLEWEWVQPSHYRFSVAAIIGGVRNENTWWLCFAFFWSLQIYWTNISIFCNFTFCNFEECLMRVEGLLYFSISGSLSSLTWSFKTMPLDCVMGYWRRCKLWRNQRCQPFHLWPCPLTQKVLHEASLLSRLPFECNLESVKEQQFQYEQVSVFKQIHLLLVYSTILFYILPSWVHIDLCRSVTLTKLFFLHTESILTIVYLL